MFQKFLSLNKVRTITILGTPTSYKENLYKYEEFEYRRLSSEEEKRLEKIIFNINTGSETPDEVIFVKKLFKRYEKISDVVIIGCTELATALDTVNSKNKIDPMDLLINYIIEKYE